METIKLPRSETGAVLNYIVIAAQDAGTCEALRYAWLSISPYVIAKSTDQEHAEEMAREVLRGGDYVVLELWR